MTRAFLTGALAIAASGVVWFTVTTPRLAPPADPYGLAYQDEAMRADPAGARVARALDARAGRVLGRIADKTELAAALVRGERTLDEVAAGFRELNAGARIPYGRHGRAESAAGEEELAYRQVLTYVRNVRADPERRAEVVRGVEEELDRRFPRADGTPAV